MRKIETRVEIEKKKKRNVAILTIILLGLLVLSTLGYAFISNYGEKKKKESNSALSDKISFEYNGISIGLLSSYEDIANVSIESQINILNADAIYIDAKNQGIYRELAINLAKIFPRVQRACYGVCEENYPEKNCTSNLIVWKEANDNKIYQIDNCIFIEGDIRAVDAFIYNLFGSLNHRNA